MVLCLLSALFFGWFAVACEGWLDSSTLSLYFSSVLGSVFLNASIPIFYELGMETTHPVAEGLTSAVLATFSNLGMLLFLVVPEIPNIGLSACVCAHLCVPPLSLLLSRKLLGQLDACWRQLGELCDSGVLP